MPLAGVFKPASSAPKRVPLNGDAGRQDTVESFWDLRGHAAMMNLA